MKTAVLNWWAGRSARERILLGLMIALLVPVFVWLLLIRPLDAALEGARTDNWAASERLLQVRADAEAMALSARTPGEPTREIVNRLAAVAGFVPSRVDPAAEGRVMLGLASAKPVALRAFVRALDREGVFVETMTIRANSDATVSVDAVLRARKG
jgi:general secretion pathway protein M